MTSAGVLRSLTDDVRVSNLGEATDWPRSLFISITTNRAAAPGRQCQWP